MNEPNGQQQIRVTPEQMAAALLIDSLLATMHLTVNQLGGFVKYEAAANIVAHAGQVLLADYQKMKENWARSVIVAPASALSVIEGKKA